MMPKMRRGTATAMVIGMMRMQTRMKAIMD